MHATPQGWKGVDTKRDPLSEQTGSGKGLRRLEVKRPVYPRPASSDRARAHVLLN